MALADLRANTGRILLGDKELMYCEGIEVNYDFNPIKHFAGDRMYPIYVAPGNSELTITVDFAYYKADEESIVQEIANNFVPVTVQLLSGIRGGGIAPTTFTNCVITNITITSRQGDVVKARLVLSKVADS